MAGNDDFGDLLLIYELEPGTSLRSVAGMISALAVEMEMPVLVVMSDMRLEVEPGATAKDIMGGYAAARADRQLKQGKKSAKRPPSKPSPENR